MTPVATQPIVDAIDCATIGGTVILAGVKGMKPVANLVSDKVVLKEITLRGAIGVTWDHYERAIRLIESRKLPLEKLHRAASGCATRNARCARSRASIRTKPRCTAS